MRAKFSFILLAIMKLSVAGLMAQAEKYEIEQSIAREEMPEKAIETLDKFWPDLDDIRYYFQTDVDTESYEAKLEWKEKKYSIEFSESGRVINVEQIVAREEISTEAKDGVDQYVRQEFRKARITRLQRQFIANDDDNEDDDEWDDEDFIDDVLEGDDDDYEIRYELEVEGRSEGQIGAFELLFDRTGDLIQRRKIIRRSVDNIW